MSANSTNSAKGRMDCGRVTREEIIESYLVGRLSDDEREAFEAHYFECARCFGELQALQAIQRELSQAGARFGRSSTRPVVRWARAAALAAAVVLAVGAILWMRPSVTPGSPEPSIAPPPPSVAHSPAQPPAASEPTSASAVPLEQLVRVEPPRYEPLRLRGVPDEATARFQRGMEQYGKADYGRAADDLREAVELDPDATHARFFLGMSYLLVGQDNAAINQLQSTIALGDSAYLEEAHFYLAKSFLRQKDLSAAEMQLKALIELRGPRMADARQLLAEVQRLKGGSN